MNELKQINREILSNRNSISMLLLSVLTLHIFMIMYEYFHPDVFFNSDRALARWNVIQRYLEFFENGKISEFIPHHGVIGDYAIHATLYMVGGKYIVIIFQIFLSLLSGLSVYKICRMLNFSDFLSKIACLIYLILPHSLLFPHQLSTEALHTPILVISLWMMAKYISDNDKRYLLLGALFSGAISLIRPVTMLWPVIAGIVVMKAKKMRLGFLYLFLAFFPVLIWMGYIYGQTGKFNLGESPHDMSNNLYRRVMRISKSMPIYQFEKIQEEYKLKDSRGALGVGDYMGFAIAYPIPFLKHTLRDSLVFFCKSGIERLFIDYLGYNKAERRQLQSSQTGWRKRWEMEGVLATLKFLWKTQGYVLPTALIGSIALLIMMSLAFVGGWSMFFDFQADKKRQHIVFLIIMLPVYIFVFSQIVDTLQSRHRAPCEVSIVILAVWGARTLSQKWKRRIPVRSS